MRKDGRTHPKGMTFLELLVAVALAGGVIVLAGTLLMAVLGTERVTRETLGSTPEGSIRDLLQDLTSCGGVPVFQETEGIRWARWETCVRVHVLDVRPTGGRDFRLVMRTAGDTAALETLRPLGEPSGSVRVRTAEGCDCPVLWTETAGTEVAVRCAGVCVPGPGPAEARPARPGTLRFWTEAVVVRPGGRLPQGAPGVVSPQGMSVVFLGEPWVGGPLPPVRGDGGGRDEDWKDPFPTDVLWFPVYVHLPSPTMEASVTLTAWGSRTLVAGDLGGPDLLTEDLDGDGDGEVETEETSARRVVPASAVEGWTLWTTGFGRLRKSLPVRCGEAVVPSGDVRECRQAGFRPF